MTKPTALNKKYFNCNLRYDEHLLTIVTINWNNALGLLKTLRSLAAERDDPNIQFIFIDGASNDNSLYIAREFYSSEYLVSEPDRGVYHAMNKGLRLAKGKYVLWLNSGDELRPGVMNRIKEDLKNSEAALVAYGVNIVDVDSRNDDIHYFAKMSDLPQKTLPHQSTFFHRSVLTELGGYSEHFKIASDRDLILRIFYMNRRIQIIPEIISNYYTGGLSSTQAVVFDNLAIDMKYGLITRMEYLLSVYRLRGRRGLIMIIMEIFYQLIFPRSDRPCGRYHGNGK